MEYHSLPQALSRSEAAVRAFSALPAGDREAYTEYFSARSRGENDTAAAESSVFMQNTQNSEGILY